MKIKVCGKCGAENAYSEYDDPNKCEKCELQLSLNTSKIENQDLKIGNVENLLIIAQTALDGGSYREAFEYYNKALEINYKLPIAWTNKGICILRMSKIGDLKIAESISAWKTAIKFSNDPQSVKKQVATEINQAVVDFYPILENHYLQFKSVKDSVVDHGNRFLLLESALSFALELHPSAQISRTGIDLCERFIQSLKQPSDKENPNIWEMLSNNELARKNAAQLELIKSKYVAAAASVDPVFAQQERIKNEKAAADDKSGNTGCAIISLIAAIIFAIGACIGLLKANGILKTDVNPSTHITPSIIFLSITVVFLGVAKFMNSKNKN